MAEIVENVRAKVKHIARKSGHIYLESDRFTRDIQLTPKQVGCAGFNPKKLRSGHAFVVDVRIEKSGGLKTSLIRSVNGQDARPPGPQKKPEAKK